MKPEPQVFFYAPCPATTSVIEPYRLLCMSPTTAQKLLSDYALGRQSRPLHNYSSRSALSFPGQAGSFADQIK
jgi:hypothetical protein